MAKAYVLNESDLSVLKQMVDWWRRTTRPSTKTDSSSDIQSPDTYVALLPDGGIPGTSGSDVGSALCDIYRIEKSGSDGTLKTLNIERRVFNLSESTITGSYAPVTRTKSGAWLFTAAYNENTDTGTGTDCISSLDGHVLDDLAVETAPAYVLGVDSNGCLVKIEVDEC